MLKRDELSDPNSCLNRADDDELIFVLIGHDVASPHAIEQWVLKRVLLGKNHPDDAHRVEDFQRGIIRGALRRQHGNQIAAAAELGFHRNTLARYLNLLGIDPSAYYRKRDHEIYRAQHGWRAAKIADALAPAAPEVTR